MYIRARKYVINIVYIVYVSANHFAILSKVRYKKRYIDILKKFVHHCTNVKYSIRVNLDIYTLCNALIQVLYIYHNI